MAITIKEILNKSGYSVDYIDETSQHILENLEWYQNNVKKFHQYKVYNGVNVVTEKMFRLGMAKKVCEDWATLLLNEKVSIKAGEYDSSLKAILERNNFDVQGNQLIEVAFALGTGAFVEYYNNNKEIDIDYIRADMIYPLTWNNGVITECAFGSEKIYNGVKCIYLQIHRFGRIENKENSKFYYIENAYFNKENGKKIPTPNNIKSVVATKSVIPLFQIIKPNIFNNIDLDSPLGISIYANAFDQLKACDRIYDSYINEFILGKKRILVPITLAKKRMQADGVEEPVFDPNDKVFYAMPGDRNSDIKLESIDMNIRAQEHELGIQRALDLLSLKCGMGTGRYKFDSSGVKTATEVISDKSDLYQNLKKNEKIINTALIGLVKAIAFLDGNKNVNVTVDFDDSIIEDSNTTIDRNIKLTQAGLRSKLSAIMEINKCSEQDAQKELEKINEDGQITGQDIDWTKGDEDEEPNDSDVEGEGNEPTE